jgi:hypothetical protein
MLLIQGFQPAFSKHAYRAFNLFPGVPSAHSIVWPWRLNSIPYSPCSWGCTFMSVSPVVPWLEQNHFCQLLSCWTWLDLGKHIGNIRLCRLMSDRHCARCCSLPDVVISNRIALLLKHRCRNAAAVAYDDPDTYTTYILFFHQSLYFDKLDKHLLCPSQMRCNQIIVNDVPPLHTPFNQRTHQDHSIVSTPPHHPLHIPLQLNGKNFIF